MKTVSFQNIVLVSALLLAAFNTVANADHTTIPPGHRPLPPPLSDASPEHLKLLSERVNALVQRRAYEILPHERRAVGENLRQIQAIILGQRPGPIDPYPPGERIIYTAECNVDDDTSFDYGVVVAGTVRGSTIEEVLGECETLGRAMYGTFSSTGIRYLDPNLSVLPRGIRQGDCWVDDDTSFDFGVALIGKVVGPTVDSLATQCSIIARDIYGTFSSSGVKNVL